MLYLIPSAAYRIAYPYYPQRYLSAGVVTSAPLLARGICWLLKLLVRTTTSPIGALPHHRNVNVRAATIGVFAIHKLILFQIVTPIYVAVAF